MSKSATWDKAMADAKKVLGNSAKIPDKKMDGAFKAADEASKAWDGLGTLRDGMKKKILEVQNVGSKVENALKQAQDEFDDSGFGLDDSQPDDKKKIALAQAIFDKFFDQARQNQKDNNTNLDELDKHLIDIKKYRRP
jgi:predicted nucleotide-binding protein